MRLRDLIDFDVLSFEEICRKIREGEHFSLARYGDGEFNAIMGVEGQNCDGHKYFPQMGEDLAETLRSNPEYFCGIHESAKIQVKTLDWLQKNEIDRTWVSNSVFHIPTRDGTFQPFWDALEGRKVCIIAPKYIFSKEVIKIVGGAAGGFPIEGENTYQYLSEINKFASTQDFEDTVTLICASMTAPLIVDHLYKQYGDTGTFLDFGSSFDPVVGRKSRSYHKII